MRTYDTPIGKLPSVTTVLGILSKPYLIPWVKKEARLAVADLIQEKPDIVKWGREEIEEACKHAIDEHNRKSKTALDLGSLVHNMIEVFYKEWEGTQAEYCDFLDNYFPEQAIKMLMGFFMTLNEEGIEVLESEMMVYHSDGFAGTLDAKVRLNKMGGKIAIGDWKTSKQLSKEYYWQTEAYRRAYGETHEAEDLPTMRIIVRIDKEDPGKVEVTYIPEERNETDWGAFKSCLDLFNAEREAESYMKSLKPKKEKKQK